MTRDEAILKLNSSPLNKDFVRKEFDFISAKLGITTKELKEYFKYPNKSFWDYKNQQFLYKIGSNVLKLFNYEMDMRR